MKNILIITTSSDNSGSQVSFVKDINDIKDLDHREMILNSLKNDLPWIKNDLWANYLTCGSEQGYIFNDYYLNIKTLPVTIEHIIDYIIN